MTASLPEAYAVFAAYPRFEAPRPCTHCISEEDQESMQGLPLPTFPLTSLKTLLFNHLVDTWGSLTDIKHFIPRMLDLLDAGDLGIEEFSRLLHKGGWRDWPEKEQAVIEDCIGRLWTRSWVHAGDDLWDACMDSDFRHLRGLLLSHGSSPWLAARVFESGAPGAAKLCQLVKNPSLMQHWSLPEQRAMYTWLASGEPQRRMAAIDDADFREALLPKPASFAGAIQSLQEALDAHREV